MIADAIILQICVLQVGFRIQREGNILRMQSLPALPFQEIQAQKAANELMVMRNNANTAALVSHLLRSGLACRKKYIEQKQINSI